MLVLVLVLVLILVLVLVLHVLIRDLGAMWKVRQIWRLDLTWMNRCGGHPRVQDVLLPAICLHMNRCWVSTGSNFDLRIVNNEIVNIIVCNDVGYNLLILLTR